MKFNHSVVEFHPLRRFCEKMREQANIKDLTDLSEFLSTYTVRDGGLLNRSEISRADAFPQFTLKRYAALLEALFLTETPPA